MDQAKIDTLKEVGVDYITATSRDTKSVSGFASFGAHLIRSEVGGGAKRNNARSLGYAGTSAGCVYFGRRHDGAILRVSGRTASEYWNQIVDLAENVSRLDLQVTVLPGEGVPARLKWLWNRRKHKSSSRGRIANIKCVAGQRGLETLMLGARSSDVYGRIYNKEIESRDPEYLGCCRFELELKSEVAKNYATSLALKEFPSMSIVATVNKFVSDRLGRNPGGWTTWRPPLVLPNLSTMPLEFTEDCLISLTRSVHNRSAHKTLKFFAKCISPSVRRLIDCGYENEVRRALGLPYGPSSESVRNLELDHEETGGYKN